jgi:hypothetical protein
MPVCPVCEHVQSAGVECDVCGKEFPATGPGAADVAPLEGLEPTLHGAERDLGERLAELEPTHAVPPATVPASPVDGLEPTGHAPAGDVAIELVGELEPTAAAAFEASAPAEGPVVCRYCRTAAHADERLCLRCGMRLPRAPRGQAAAAALRRCSDCGNAAPGAVCPACGARQLHG